MRKKKPTNTEIWSLEEKKDSKFRRPKKKGTQNFVSTKKKIWRLVISWIKFIEVCLLMSCLEKKTENKKKSKFRRPEKKRYAKLCLHKKKQTKQKNKTKNKNMAVSASHELSLLRYVY